MKSRALATVCGLLLFALPFFQSGFGDAGTHGSVHMDHEPHHGGRLLMLGNHHLEILERPGRLELFVSDAARRPLRPDQATVAFDAEPPAIFEWSSYRMVVAKPHAYQWADYRIALAEGPPLTIRLPFRE
jgi:hypothetical protein